MSTRRTRNNPSPSGLKSLPYGPQKRTDKKTAAKKAVDGDSDDQPPQNNKKRNLLTSSADSGPPAKKRMLRSKVAPFDRNSLDHGDAADDAEERDDGNSRDITMQDAQQMHVATGPEESYSSSLLSAKMHGEQEQSPQRPLASPRGRFKLYPGQSSRSALSSPHGHPDSSSHLPDLSLAVHDYIHSPDRASSPLVMPSATPPHQLNFTPHHSNSSPEGLSSLPDDGSAIYHLVNSPPEGLSSHVMSSSTPRHPSQQGATSNVISSSTPRHPSHQGATSNVISSSTPSHPSHQGATSNVISSSTPRQSNSSSQGPSSNAMSSSTPRQSNPSSQGPSSNAMSSSSQKPPVPSSEPLSKAAAMRGLRPYNNSPNLYQDADGKVYHIHKPTLLTPKPAPKPPKKGLLSNVQTEVTGPKATEPLLQTVPERGEPSEEKLGAKMSLQQEIELAPSTSKLASRSPVKRQPVTTASSPKPSTTISKPSKFNPITLITCQPASEIVLTRPELIDAALALVKWAERDETRRLPNAEQMEALLETFSSREAAEVTSPSPSPPRTFIRARGGVQRGVQRGARRRPRPHESDLSNDDGDVSDNASEQANANPSEVPSKMQPPQTPAPQPQESRGFWGSVSAVKSIFTSPLHLFDRRRNEPELEPEPKSDGQTATTDREPVTEELIAASLVPRPTKNFTTPSRAPIRRTNASQSERRARAQSTGRRRPQTERRRPQPQEEETKPPIHLRGVSQERIAEIRRQQDRQAEEDRQTEERRKKRESQAAEAEAEDEPNPAKPSTPPEQPGEKRKRPKGTVRTPRPNPPGTFRVPSPYGSSDDSSDPESDENTIIHRPYPNTPTWTWNKPVDVDPTKDEAPKPAPPPTRWTPITPGPRQELIADDAADASPFTSFSLYQPFTNIWKDVDSSQYPRRAIEPAPVTSERSTGFERPTGFGTSGSFGVRETNNSWGSHGKDTSTSQLSDSSVLQSKQWSETPSSVLQSKQWSQTPPPKPRPGNAQLPQVPPRLSAAAEAAKAKAEKFKPKQPSSLRNVTHMSPLQIEKENLLVRQSINLQPSLDRLLSDGGVSKASWEFANQVQDTFYRIVDPDVLAAVNAIPPQDVAGYPLPPSLSPRENQESEVEREVSVFFR